MDAHHRETFSGADSRRMSTRLTILKDDIQAVLPIAKSWSVVNTAVLTGRQVSRAMKVLIVSQAGKVADVTLQSSCNCTEEAALKVSASCTSVYLDGSEVRGSHNATVVARYDILTGSASFTVWMPELPLTVHVRDTKLSQVRGWRSPDPATTATYAVKLASPVIVVPHDAVADPGNSMQQLQQQQQHDLSRHRQEDNAIMPLCSVRYQQTPVQVYGRFVAVDDNSGRQSYLLSRRAQVRVTELVAHLLRVADTSVAILDHTTLMGRAPGRTEVQVLSPITGRVIGAREVRVGSDKVWVSRLRAAVISGLTLSLQPDAHLPDGYSAITTVTPTLTAKYQEGLVDVWVEMSDGVVMPLREVPPSHYSLRVRSLDPGVVAVAPSPRTAQPRVIAIGHGTGDLLEVSLEVSEECEHRRASLATTKVHVKIDLGTTPPPPPPAHDNDLRPHHSLTDDPTHHKLKVHVSELPHADAAAPQNHLMLMAEQPQQPTMHSRLHPPRPSGVTPLEVGMYVLLAVFGAAIVVFAASYVVYTWSVRGGKPMLPPSHHTRRSSHHNHHDSVTNAHDWVWLGRATLERASGMGLSPPSQSASTGMMPLSDLNGNSQEQQLQQQQQEQQQLQSTWQELQRLSRGFDRSPIPINITTNPAAEEETDTTHTPHLSGSTTFTRPSRNNRRVTFNNLGEDAAACSSEEERPPIPPHRNIGVTANISGHDDSNPPPVPPHGVNVISNPLEEGYSGRPGGNGLEGVTLSQLQQAYTQQQQQRLHPSHIQQQQQQPHHHQEKEMSDPKFVEVNADDFVRLRGVCRGRAGQVRRATILENPLLSSALPDNFSVTDHLDNLPPSMDYDQLMEYFSNLKESNA
ncbi:transmembrane protein 132E [Cherax quadricarinatus]